MYQLAKLGRRSGLVAEPRQVAFDQRMLNLKHAAHICLHG